MGARALIGRIAAAILLCSALAAPARAQQEEPGSPRARAPLTILQVNDVYSTIPLGGVGGLARVATVKQRIAAAGGTPLLVIAGDFLSPSVASSVFKGEQMVAALNAAGLDMATLGNHEFDFGTDLLLERMKQAKWTWVISNVIDTETGKPIGGASPYVIREFGPLKIGFIGLCLTTSEISRDRLTHIKLLDPIDAAAAYVPELHRQGVTAIVAITHLAFADDRRLVESFPEIQLVVGGHEHYPLAAVEHGTLISKAGSDARWVARLDLIGRPDGTLERFYELMPITSAIPDDKATAVVVQSYEDRLGDELDQVIGTTKVPLDAETARLRASETNIGDFVADVMRASTSADIAIMNSGSIRGDRVYPPGPIRRRTIVAIHPFGGVICKVEVPGRIVLEALNRGVSKLPASAGQFPQVSGLTMTVDLTAPPGSRVRDVHVNGTPLDPDKHYTVAITDYTLNGGDDYTMFAGQKVLIGPESGDLLVNALEKAVAARKEIAPAVDGRITIVR